MDPFIRGVIAGYGIAIPVGVIAILIIEAGLRYGFRIGFAAGAGAATADLIYASLAAVAGQTLTEILAPYSAPIHYLSATVLVCIGGWGLWKAMKTQQASPGLSTQQSFSSETRSARHTYVRFVALTIINPMTVAYFGAIILGGSGALAGWSARLLFVIGAALSSLSWQAFLAGIGAIAHRRFSPGTRRVVSVLGSLIVITLGIRMIWF